MGCGEGREARGGEHDGLENDKTGDRRPRSSPMRAAPRPADERDSRALLARLAALLAELLVLATRHSLLRDKKRDGEGGEEDEKCVLMCGAGSDGERNARRCRIEWIAAAMGKQARAPSPPPEGVKPCRERVGRIDVRTNETAQTPFSCGPRGRRAAAPASLTRSCCSCSTVENARRALRAHEPLGIGGFEEARCPVEAPGSRPPI